jgi:hypothetical protein
LEDLCRDLAFNACILGTEVHVEFSNLVGIHARSRYLNRTCPVEVVVTQIKCELLNYFLRQLGVIQSNIEVSGQNTSLSGKLRNEIEIIFLIRIFILN